jgi:hypothetical protein
MARYDIRADIRTWTDAAKLQSSAAAFTKHAEFYAARVAQNRTSTPAARVEHAEALRLTEDYRGLAAIATARLAEVAA